jgi:dihydrofolate reductase
MRKSEVGSLENGKISSSLSTSDRRLPTFSAIAACDPNGVMGLRGGLPWYCPEDLRHFRNTTLGHVLVMGYRTFREFDERTNILFTDFEDLEQKYALHKEWWSQENYVIGGAKTFTHFFEKQLIKHALISHMKKSYEGDTIFPLRFLNGWPHKLIRETEEFRLVEYANLF